MLFSLLSLLAPMLLGEIPPNTGPTVQTPGEKPVAPGATTTPGVPDPSSATPGQPSPKPHQIIDTEFYALNPNKPTELVLGKRVKELQALAAQFNTAQSKLHDAENTLQEVQTKNVQLEGQVKQATDSQFVVNKLAELGIKVQEPNPAPVPASVPGQTYMTPEQIALQNSGVGSQTDAWGNPIIPQPVPQSQVQQPMTIDSTSLPVLVAALKEAFQPDLQGMLEKLQNQASQNDQERSLKEQTSRYFTNSFDTKIESLVSSGVDRIEATRIATIESDAREAERQAEELFKVTGPQRVQAIDTATNLMSQAETYRADAAQARSQGVTQALVAKTKQDAVDLLERDSFVGVDQSKILSGDPNTVRLYKDKDIQAAKSNSLETAIKLAEESERVKTTAGLL